MLIEKIAFIAAVIASVTFTWRGFARVFKQIGLDRSKFDPETMKTNLLSAAVNTLLLKKTFKTRIPASILHAFIALGFVMFLFVNVGDLIKFFTGYPSFGIQGFLDDAYRAKVELFSLLILIGIIGMMIRRFVLKPPQLGPNVNNQLSSIAKSGITKDSMIVGAFIFIHTGARILGEAFYIAAVFEGKDASQPVTSAIAGFLINTPHERLLFAEHAMFWLSFGSILLFLPYFPKSKHIHLFFAPINFLIKPIKRSIGEQPFIDIEDESIEIFGAEKVSELPFEQKLDSYACIMCFRCQDVCPPAQTGKLLSPAVIEINKRYALNTQKADRIMLRDVIAEEAAWACTTCGACVDICPVGNEPMRDILEYRRFLTLNEDSAPQEFEPAFKGLERNANPWNAPRKDRMAWATGLDIPTVEENPQPEVLWWVGCAPSTDPRSQKTSRAFAAILKESGVNFAVLGNAEKCTGDAARRAGREDIFFELASENVENLNAVPFKTIVTTCPHCYHTLKNEYPAFGGEFQVKHHTELINDLLLNGELQLRDAKTLAEITYHDPCYIGRHNPLTVPARQVLGHANIDLIELPNHAENTFCCGAGGAQFWKEEEQGDKRVSQARFEQVSQSGANTLAVACPFCLSMMSDANKDAGEKIEVKDIAEIVEENMLKSAT